MNEFTSCIVNSQFFYERLCSNITKLVFYEHLGVLSIATIHRIYQCDTSSGSKSFILPKGLELGWGQGSMQFSAFLSRESLSCWERKEYHLALWRPLNMNQLPKPWERYIWKCVFCVAAIDSFQLLSLSPGLWAPSVDGRPPGKVAPASYLEETRTQT